MEDWWKYGKNIRSTTAKTAYINEYINPNVDIENIYSAKIGLMYTSDYGFAAIPNAWTSILSSYDSYINDNWMYMGVREWTVVRESGTEYGDFVFWINESGQIGYGTRIVYTENAWAVRPVFYLNSDVTYVSGSGTKESPLIID